MKQRIVLGPFLSVMILIGTLLLLVFLQMEERRLGYVLFRLEKQQRILTDKKWKSEVLLTKLTRPQLVEKMAQRNLTLKKIASHQVIHMDEASQ
jgi:hypothetical protein